MVNKRRLGTNSSNAFRYSGGRARRENTRNTRREIDGGEIDFVKKTINIERGHLNRVSFFVKYTWALALLHTTILNFILIEIVYSMCKEYIYNNIRKREYT